jgi:Uma2 family endonuclease
MMAHARDSLLGENRPMHMALKAHRWTRADLDRLPDDGNRYEVVDGALFVVPPPSIRHERIHLVLAKRLRPFVEANDLGDVYNGRTCVVLGENQVEPDLIVSKTPLPVPDKWDFMPAPLLVVEVLSGSTSRHDRIEKRRLYRAQVPEYWIIDGRARSIEVVTRGQERTTTDLLVWKPHGCASSLEIDLAALFAEAVGDVIASEAREKQILKSAQDDTASPGTP